MESRLRLHRFGEQLRSYDGPDQKKKGQPRSKRCQDSARFDLSALNHYRTGLMTATELFFALFAEVLKFGWGAFQD